MSTTEVVILSGCRTPIGSFGGAFKDVSAVELGTAAVREAVRRAGIRPDQVDEVILGCILQAGIGMNPARQCIGETNLCAPPRIEKGESCNADRKQPV